MSNPSGLGGLADPIRVDPTGTTVQPVSVTGTVTTTGGGGGPVTMADGANVTQGALADVAVTSDVSGTLSAKLRGLVKILADVWDSVNHRLKVDGSGVTQPVSAAALPLPAGASTAAKQPALGTAGVASADVITMQGVASMVAVKIDGSAVTQPVSGTVTGNQGTANTAANAWPHKVTDGTNTAAVKAASTAAAATDPALVVAVSPNNTVAVTAPTLTKGTQGAAGFSTQDLKDSGRVMCTFTASAVAGVTTEALITLTPYRDLVAGSAATTFAVTAGKRLRLQSIIVTWRNNTAAAGGVTIRLRLLAGTVLVTSPVQASLNATTSLATIGSGVTAFIDLPDGMELSGTMQLGLTQLAVGAVVGFDVHVIGYEY